MSIKSEITHKIIRLLGCSSIPVWASRYSSLAVPFIPLNHQFRSDDKVRIRRDGVLFEVNRSDYMQWHIWADLVEDNWRHCLRFHRKGSTIIDVGANIGAYSLKVARHLKLQNDENAKVVAVEANPEIARILKIQIDLNSDLRPLIDVWDLALGDYNGSVSFVASKSNTGGGKISISDSHNAINVPIHRLDDLIFERNLQNIGILKIDVEGFEPEVLAGAQALIHRDRPVLYLEVTDPWIRSRGHSPFELLIGLKRKFGYECYLDGGKTISPIEITEPNLDKIFSREKQINVLCLSGKELNS
jgi:FkbM family methyltransferase